jgi:putative transposase
MRAPGKFVEILRRKAASAGDVEIIEFPTRSTRLSQTCICGNIHKKPLSQRWHSCDYSVSTQRDLLSAFLASCVEDDLLNADLVHIRWSGMDTCLQAALSNIPQLANGQPLPSSFGLNLRRQSESPVKVLPRQHEACVAVPSLQTSANGRTQESAASARTPLALAVGSVQKGTLLHRQAIL